MPSHRAALAKMPVWAWVFPLVAVVLLASKAVGLFPAAHPLGLAVAAALLGGCVFSAVHHAEIIALRVGEPLGSIILAIAVTIIEVALIVSLMLSASVGSDAYARDTVYSAVMIVLNGVVGLCLVLGGARHHEQSFQVHGAASSLGVLGTLATIALVLPNFTRTTVGPLYAPSQLMFVGMVSLCLYGVFLFVQTVRHRDYFLSDEPDPAADAPHHETPTVRATQHSAILLCIALAAVVLLAKILSYPLERGIAAVGLPPAFVGVVIAALVLLPEGMAAVQAARANRLQTSLNLALGSALASIGLTIPVVAAVSIFNGQRLVLGLQPSEMVLLLLTLFISTLTLATGRTTVLQGAVHLVIFGVFLFLSAVP
jgi:Ca2+:H+ antiporter